MDKTSVVRVQRWIVCHACVIDGVLDRELNPKPQAEAENAGAESHSSYEAHKEPHVA